MRGCDNQAHDPVGDLLSADHSIVGAIARFSFASLDHLGGRLSKVVRPSNPMKEVNQKSGYVEIVPEAKLTGAIVPSKAVVIVLNYKIYK